MQAVNALESRLL